MRRLAPAGCRRGLFVIFAAICHTKTTKSRYDSKKIYIFVSHGSPPRSISRFSSSGLAFELGPSLTFVSRLVTDSWVIPMDVCNDTRSVALGLRRPGPRPSKVRGREKMVAFELELRNAAISFGFGSFYNILVYDVGFSVVGLWLYVTNRVFIERFQCIDSDSGKSSNFETLTVVFIRSAICIDTCSVDFIKYKSEPHTWHVREKKCRINFRAIQFSHPPCCRWNLCVEEKDDPPEARLEIDFTTRFMDSRLFFRYVNVSSFQKANFLFQRLPLIPVGLPRREI